MIRNGFDFERERKGEISAELLEEFFFIKNRQDVNGRFCPKKTPFVLTTLEWFQSSMLSSKEQFKIRLNTEMTLSFSEAYHEGYGRRQMCWERARSSRSKKTLSRQSHLYNEREI